MKVRRKRNSQFHRSLAGACSVIFMLCASQAGLAQQGVPTQPAKAIAAAAATPAANSPVLKTTTEEEATSAPRKPGGEGIRVHGHWKFVVHDAAGKLVSTREFENSLISPGEGDFTLAFVLSGYAVASDWAIVLCPQTGS